MTLHVHRAERADRLAAALADLLANPLDDVFAEEVIAVPARGVERWLIQRLSHRLGRQSGREDGVCAGVRFPSTGAIIAEILEVDEHDPWAPDSLVWPLLRVIDTHASEPWCVTLGSHLGAGLSGEEAEVRRGRRYAVARRLAGLFDSYATLRPSMISAWADGRDEDGMGAALPDDLAWQPPLWRLLRDEIKAPDPVERAAAAIERVSRDPAAVDLPERLSVFGPTRFPITYLQVLAGLSEHRDVHLWLPHPSPALWQAVSCVASGSGRRRDDRSADVPRHPLLASLGRDVREFQQTLAATCYQDHHHPLDDRSESLLELLQRDLAGDHRPTAGDRQRVDPGDRSVQVHACHGPARQVDVLREVLVGLLADDPTLEPRDILVMCPDVETYASLISAAFGLAEVVEHGHPAHELRVRLADRALDRTNPLLATVARLLELADSRLTASQVLDLAAYGPIRRRFELDDQDLERIATWVREAGVRWGVDGDARGPFGLDGFVQNTWRAGLDRILLGAAMADEDQNMLGLALPLDDVGSGEVELAGRLAELMDRLTVTLASFRPTRALGSWLVQIEQAVERLTRTPDGDQWQLAELHRELGDIADGAGEGGSSTVLALSDVRALLAGRLGARPTRANFRTGTLTVCTMVPMRSVPHRVICLIGLDDGVFPRGARLDGDDVLARDPVVGERDPRGEDRQLMLDALLAATERVVITYTGADERTGARRPPAVPVGELLDALDDTAVMADGRSVREHVLVRHPLQPFDGRNFESGALGRPGPFGYDATALAAARAAAGPRRSPPRFLEARLDEPPPQIVRLADLVEMITRPVRAFLKNRLGVAIRFDEAEPSDALAVELDNLERWTLGDRLLRDLLAGADLDGSRQAEWRRGFLPPGPLGGQELEHVLRDVVPLVERTAELRAAERRSVDVVAVLDDGREVRGTVAGVYGSCAVSIGYRRLDPRGRLPAWINLVALAAARPDVQWNAVTAGRGKRRGGAREATLEAVAPDLARRVLGELVDLYDRGRAEPLPVSIRTSAAYAIARHAGDAVPDAVRAATEQWETRTGRQPIPGEGAEAAHVQVWGVGAPIEVLLDHDVPADEQWLADETCRFGQLARRIWAPLLAHEHEGPL